MRARAELAQGTAQLDLDRARGDEQLLGDLALRTARGGQRRDALLGRGQHLHAARHGRTRVGADGEHLVPDLLEQALGAAHLGDLVGAQERLAGVVGPAGAAPGDAERGERLGELEPDRRLGRELVHEVPRPDVLRPQDRDVGGAESAFRRKPYREPEESLLISDLADATKVLAIALPELAGHFA